MRLLPIFALMVLFAAYASAETYYADMSIDLDPAGYAAVSGSTNHPLLESPGSHQWTSKKGAVWLFNLTLPEQDVFSDFIYEVDLPPGASINYVKSSGEFRISSAGDRIKVTGIGEDEALSVVIQYTVNETGIKGNGYELLFFGAVILIILGALSYSYRRQGKKKKQAVKKITTPDPAKAEPVPDLEAYSLTDRQKEIYALLSEARRPVNQSFICEKLDLPKSSVSRNVDSLERKGLISKVREGMSTLVSIKNK